VKVRPGSANGLASADWLPRDEPALREIGTKLAGTDLASPTTTWLTVAAHLAASRSGGSAASSLADSRQDPERDRKGMQAALSIIKTQMEN
jgi:hypothetical protein